MHRVTVVMNTFNERQDWLCQAVESYLAQESVDLQLIVSTAGVTKEEAISAIEKSGGDIAKAIMSLK